MPKKRKLNSKNPRWNKKKEEKKYKRVLINKQKHFKIYFSYEVQEH